MNFQILLIILISLLRISFQTCDKEFNLGGEDSSEICSNLFLLSGECPGGTTFSAVTKLLRGTTSFYGELESEAILTTECVTGPMRMFRNINHKLSSVKVPTRTDLPMQNHAHLTYPKEECSWNWLSNSVIESSIPVVVTESIKGTVSPFENKVRIKDELCPIIYNSVGMKPVVAQCKRSKWTSDKKLSELEHDVIDLKTMDVCIRSGFIIEKETGIVLGKDSYCFKEILGETFLMTSDHLLIKPHTSWNMTSIKECKDKDNFDTLDETKFGTIEREQLNDIKKEGILLCDILGKCNEKCNITSFIKDLNKFEKGKPGKYLNFKENNDSKISVSVCYHDSLSDRTLLKDLASERSHVSLGALDMLSKVMDKQANELEIALSEDGSIIPDHIVSKNSLSGVILVMLLIVLFYIICVCCALKKYRSHDRIQYP